MQDQVLGELDQRMINAVQVAPRAPWSALAPVVGADATTLSRRWERLRSDGIVYVTGYGDSWVGAFALVEMELEPGQSLNVAADLARDREVFTIDLTAGGRDMLLSIETREMADLSTWVLERIQRVHGVRSLRTHLVSGVVTDARGWRLRALTREEVVRIERRTATRHVSMPRVRHEELAAVRDVLAVDGRAPVSLISERSGLAPRKVRDVIAALMTSGDFAVRVDVARQHTPWPVYAWYFLRVPADRVAGVGPQLGRMDEVRLVVTAVGAHNVIMAVWLRTLNDVNRVEAIIEKRLPGVTIEDRSVVLRTAKHLGHRLDEDGRATLDTVPML